jgi:hypothetical protein
MDPLKEFLAWFGGFTEVLEGPPNEKQWKRIVERVGKLAKQADKVPASSVPAPLPAPRVAATILETLPVSTRTVDDVIRDRILNDGEREWLRQYSVQLRDCGADEGEAAAAVSSKTVVTRLDPAEVAINDYGASE